ncbi:tetratricopeptide repeat protein [Diaminobutyricibacter sp. McL0608]
MAVLLLIYLVLVFDRGVLLIQTGDPIAIVMGVALFVLPVIAAWAIGRELLFGARTEKLVHILDEEGGLPVDDLPHRASGRPLREAADADFPQYKAEVEAEPLSWRAWFRLGLAYDASGDRKRARAALRESIRLYRDGERKPA